MRETPGRRLFTALAVAILIGFCLAYVNPVSRIKADLRADARGFAISLEYIAHNVAG